MSAYSPLGKMFDPMLQRSASLLNKIEGEMQRQQQLIEKFAAASCLRDINIISDSFAKTQLFIESTVLNKVERALGSKPHPLFGDTLEEKYPEFFYTAANIEARHENQAVNLLDENEINLKLLFWDENYQFYNPELVAAIILWSFLYENNLFQQSSRNFLKDKVCNYFPEFKGKEKALKRIITMVRSGSVRGRKMKRPMSILIDSKEKIISKLENVIRQNLTAVYMQSSQKFHSCELKAAFTLFRHLEKNNLFEKCTVAFLIETLYSLFPEYKDKKPEERDRIITVLRTGKGLP